MLPLCQIAIQEIENLPYLCALDGKILFIIGTAINLQPTGKVFKIWPSQGICSCSGCNRSAQISLFPKKLHQEHDFRHILL